MGQKAVARTRYDFQAGRLVGRRRLVPLCLMVLILMRAMIPVGFMPDLSGFGQGLFEIVICTGDGARTITAHQDGGAAPPAHPQKRGEHSFDLCAFALAMTGALVVLGLILTLFRYGPSQVFLPSSVEWRVSTGGAGALGPRAPPLT